LSFVEAIVSAFHEVSSKADQAHARAKKKREDDIEKLGRKYEADKKKLEELIALDEDVVSRAQKEAYVREFDAAYAPHAKALGIYFFKHAPPPGTKEGASKDAGQQDPGDDRAKALTRLCGESNDENVCHRLGNAYLVGEYGLPVDHRRAFDILERNCLYVGHQRSCCDAARLASELGHDDAELQRGCGP
jgi:TPR repeat protein